MILKLYTKEDLITYYEGNKINKLSKLPHRPYPLTIISHKPNIVKKSLFCVENFGNTIAYVTTDYSWEILSNQGRIIDREL